MQGIKRSSFMMRILIVLLILGLTTILIPTQAQTEPLFLTKEIVGNPTNIDTGQVIEYRLIYSCNSLTTDCGNLTIQDVLPTNVTWLETQVASGFSESFDAGTNTVTITSDGIFADGDQSEALIRARVNFDVPGGTDIDNFATGDRSNSVPDPDVTTPIVSVTVNDPSFNWEVRKSKVSPSIGPALDNDVTYDVQVCSNTAVGNVTLDNVVLTDNLPPNVIIVDDGGGTVTGDPATGQTISWTLGELDIAVIGSGCVTRTITIQYPSTFYAVNDIPDNIASAEANYDDGTPTCTTTPCPIGTETTSVTIEPDQPDPGGSKNNSGAIVGIGAVGRFFVNVNTSNANVPVNNLIVTDSIDPQLQITQINANGWSEPATLEYSTDGVTFISLGTFQNGVALNSPADFPTDVTDLRWSFTGSVPFGFSGQAEVVFTPRDDGGANDAIPGDSYQNCFDISADAPATGVNGCSDVTIDDDVLIIAPNKTTVGGSTARPEDILTFNLRLRIDERSAVPLLNPVISEALPDELEYITDTTDEDYTDPIISFTNVAGGEEVQPTLSIQNGVTIDGVTYNNVLVWTWPPGYQLTPPTSGVSDINIQFTARVLPGTIPGNYTNQAYFVSDSPDTVCDTGTQQVDTEDLDNDGDTAEDRCFVTVNYEVQETVVLSSQKWISSPSYQADTTFTGFLNTEIAAEPEPDATCPSSTFASVNPAIGTNEYTRFPCVTQGFPDNANFVPPDPDDFDDFFYWLVVRNSGNIQGSDYIMYDILPYVGDTGSGGPLSGSARESEFQPYIIGPITIESLPAGLTAADITIEYSNSTNPCRTEVFNDTGGLEPAGCVNDWTTVAPTATTPNDVRAFRIYFNNAGAFFPVLSEMQFSVPMRIPEDAQSGQIAWNSFAQRVSNPGTGRVPTSEARKVGITVPERMSVGNYVWFDYNNDGTPTDDDGVAEAPVVGATVSLYRDTNNDGVPDGAAIATDVTDANGFYLFGDIVYDSITLANNRYVIGVDAPNFDTGNPLFAHLSSTGTNGDNQTDLDDNGIDDLDPLNATYGILGPSFLLDLDTEPTNETQLSGDDPADFPTGTLNGYPDGPFSRGVRAEPDNNSDLTIDFGFYVPMSIGNRVWFDTGINTNNGIEDADEAGNGVDGVALTLYRDNGTTDGSIDAGDQIVATTTTDANGYYLFDNLPPGTYFVAVDQANFDPGGVLRAYEDSDNVPNVDEDRENKGEDDTFLGNVGVVSIPVDLVPFTEPVAGATTTGAEVDQTIPAGFINGFGNSGELDENSNLTIDFGFWTPGMSLGNFVWNDIDNDNVFDAGETGLDGITINLYLDTDEDGTPDGAIFATTTTTNGGFYLFDNLAPGGYIVEIPASEFNAGGDLVGFISSNRNDTIDTLVPPLTVPTGNFDTDWDDQQDDGLNQPDAAGYRANGIRSETVTLIPVSEPFDVDGSEPDGGLGIGAGGKDENSDLTVDFGVFEPLSIGNRVWIDDYSSGDGVSVKGDGVFDMVNESPIDGVTLTLYQLNDGGDPNNIADYSIVQFNGVNQTDTTDDNGYYLFDGLGQGTYRVLVDAANFTGILTGYRSSDGLNGADNTDSGIDDDAPATNGIFSEPIVLGLTTEPTGETDANDAGQAVNRDDGPLGYGVFEEDDNNSDLTVDFGFYIPPMSLGNRVWYDTNNNGIIDAGDDNPTTPGNPGIGGVTVNLYDAGDTTTPIAITTTDAQGYYLFDDLVPGDYVVGIPVGNFAGGQALENLTSSTGNGGDNQADTDFDENGIDDLTVPLPNEIFSTPINLTLDAETLTEGDLSADTASYGPDNQGLNGEQDDNSDLTVDFGFFEPLSIGNVVWLDDGDDGAGGYTIAEFNNGVQDANEDGIPNVTVNLYLDANTNGVIDGGELVATELTDANGYYLFDGLIGGQYIVEIDAANFAGVLTGLQSSTGNTADETTDLNDNGIDNPNFAAVGIVSNPIVLTIDGEPTGEPDLSNNATNDGPNFIGNFGEDDNNSNVTVDFGFNAPPMSLGNRVWYDTNNDGTINAGDDNPAATGNPGIGGVTVNLYLPTDLVNPIGTTITDAQGYYLFDNLQAGDYVVGIPESNFGAGQPLVNLASSTGNGGDNGADTNVDENGIDDLTVPLPNTIYSETINLTVGAETEAEVDLSADTATYGPDNQGLNGETDNSSDLTVDFGFFEPLSLGNVVWLDDGNNGAGGFTVADRNNGIQDVNEVGIANVTVNLYLASDLTTPIASELTDANGYYLFDGLPEEDYVVQIDPANFAGVLTGLESSFGNTADETTDINDNGIDDVDFATNGVFSNPVTLAINSEQTGETDLSNNTVNDGADFIGRFGEDDDSSNVTIDFGFVAPPLSLGNRVWYDTNNNGIIDAEDDNPATPGNPGIGGVTVNLYLASDTTTPIGTTTTDAQGYYLFDNLLIGDYVVGIPVGNFGAGQPLLNLTSSTGNGGDNGEDTDVDENGIDDLTVPLPNEVFSAPINLTVGAEVIDENDLSADTATYGPDNQGLNGEADADSDLTVDFGFFEPLSIGNVVWLDDGDDGAGGFTIAEFNNGIQDANEAGIANVTVNLYRDANTNGVIDGGELFATELTDANGYYLFDGVPTGQYIVQVDAANFAGVLTGLQSSFGNTADETTDLNDNGIDDAAAATNGINSNVIVLTINGEQTGETDLSNNAANDGPLFIGRYGEDDDSSNVTIDFGFNAPPMSLGNRVWLDDNNSGTIDAADGATPGITGVAVSLYIDADQNGVPDGAGIAIATDTTDAEGYYLFDNLPPGDYVVGVDASNFGVGAILENYGSSTTENANAGTGGDSDDEGIDDSDPATNGIFGASINLAVTTEPIGEADLSNDAGDGAVGERRGTNGEADNSSDLTHDFGFFRSMSIGNVVWADNGLGGGVGSNGIQDGGEVGIPSVTVSLFLDDGTYDPLTDTPIATDTTDANGFYLFDGLIPGNYYVWIDDTNFQMGGALADFDSSPGNDIDNGEDLDDNGIDENFPEVDGISSPQIVLVRDNEPTTETALSGDAGDGPNSIGNNNEINTNSDISVDFGFNVEPFSLGNRVWFDPNNNGIIDAGELGIANVTVNLYRDDNMNGVIDAGEFVESDITDAEGYYLFDGLTTGFYIVELDELEFRIGGDLVDLISSTGNGTDNQQDSDVDENGVDDITPDVGGIISVPIELTKNDEPINEADLSNDAGDGPAGERRGINGEIDSNSDLTVDFGLYKPMSIGNIVWFDTNDSGTIDGLEAGIPNVVVNLYVDDGTGNFTLNGTDITDAGGYYLFSNLIPGTYYVEVAPSNFTGGQPLDGLNSSTGNTADATDSNDNGIDDADPGTNGIISNTVTLTIDGQPTGETDISGDPGDGPNSIGNSGETDNNSDITIDFGFVGAQMSLGNRVWLDPNNNGILDVGELGIENVIVNLYRDTDADGLPNGAILETTTTDADGYYIFDGLTPGDYIVALPNSNFAAGNPLEGLLSSTGNGGDTQQDSDVDENGNDTLNTTFGLISDTITLTINSESTTEADLGPDGDGTNGETPDNSELTVDFGLYQPMALGNRVWFDTNNNGIRDAGEAGVGGVVVNLYQDDGTGTFVQVGTTTTDGNGYYIFDGLPEGDYYVEIDPTNFQAGGVLVNLNSSTGETADAADDNDNGIDDIDPATNGILSNVTTLTLTTEPTDDNDLGPDGNGTNGETDANSDLSIDFGFFGGTMSIGNRVWFDDGIGGGTARDGIRDAGELPVANVAMSLYADSDADGIPDGVALATTTTDADGYYIFDGLAPGNYIVGLNASNFAAGGGLVGYTSTTTNPSTVADTDDDDDGIDNVNPALNGILSDTITLQLTTEPTTEADLGPDGDGANGETPDNSNLTVDFGVYKPLSLGNRVWFDTDDSGTINGTETGIANVSVTLFLDENANGVPDAGEEVGTDTTDGDGYYLFDDLEVGDYIVVVDAINFQAGGALEGFTSSTGDATDVTDSNDNGIDDVDPATNGILSNLITLTEDSAPTGETDTSGDVNDGPNFRGTNGETDNNSDLTVDFGFFANAMSLGNRVWLDDGAGGGTPNNGIQDGGELGIANVAVNLFADTNNDGVPDGTALRTDTTDADGYYLFDGLPPGNYIVQIAPSNFQTGNPLFGLFSSTGNTNDDTDSNDNGIDNTNPGSNGILSATVQLVSDMEPTGETDLGPDGNGANGETDENANVTVDFGFSIAYDLGDAPDTYGTTTGSTGAQHVIVSTLRLGDTIDDEVDGQPSVGADGDDANSTDDEDSVTFPTFVAGTSVDVDVSVFNNTGSDANVVIWIDFDDNGTFDAGEGFTATVPSSATPQVVPVTITVPIDADVTTGGSTYARIRLTTDGIGTGDATGLASDGEVEDYVVTIDPPGLVITKTDSQPTIQAGQETTYIITIGNSGLDVVNRNFVDNIPTADPDGFDPTTITWTCTPSGGASCITGTATASDTGTGPIDTFIDIPRDGEIVFELTATLRSTYTQTTVTNVAELGSGESAEDINDVVSDQPVGTKSGTVVDDNTIRWTMTWANVGNTAQAATITDVISSDQTFDGNLDCNTRGTSIATSCVYNPVTNAVEWVGTLGIGNANRVTITFDVRVSRTGGFSNTSVVTLGTVTTSTSGDVRIQGDNPAPTPPPENDAQPGPIIGDPIIVKLVDPAFIQPGEEAVWTLTVTNPNSVPLNGISVSDDVPVPLEVISATATIGTVTLEGQVVRILIDTLPAGETSVIDILTRLDPTFDQTVVTNSAFLDAPYIGDSTSNLQIITELPDTGEVTLWMIVARNIVIILASAVLLTALYIGITRIRRRS